MKKKYVKPQSTVVVVNADGRLMDVSGVQAKGVTVSSDVVAIDVDISVNNTASKTYNSSNGNASWSDLGLSLSPRSNDIWDDGDDW